jgi:hypothetical protein
MTAKNKLVVAALVLLLLAGTISAFGDQGATQESKSWGFTAEVLPSSDWIGFGSWVPSIPWIGAIFHLGDRFIIRPGIWVTAEPPDVVTIYGLKSDFLITIRRSGNFLWYAGLAVYGTLASYWSTEDVYFWLETAVKTGVQLMVTENFGFFTDLGIVAIGEVKGGEPWPDYTSTKSYGLGAVFYIK